MKKEEKVIDLEDEIKIEKIVEGEEKKTGKLPGGINWQKTNKRIDISTTKQTDKESNKK